MITHSLINEVGHFITWGMWVFCGSQVHNHNWFQYIDLGRWIISKQETYHIITISIVYIPSQQIRSKWTIIWKTTSWNRIGIGALYLRSNHKDGNSDIVVAFFNEKHPGIQCVEVDCLPGFFPFATSDPIYFQAQLCEKTEWLEFNNNLEVKTSLKSN